MATKRFHWRSVLGFFLGGVIVLTIVHVYIFLTMNNAAVDTGSLETFQTASFTEQELHDALERYGDLNFRTRLD